MDRFRYVGEPYVSFNDENDLLHDNAAVYKKHERRVKRRVDEKKNVAC
jgi:hypothetical protein